MPDPFPPVVGVLDEDITNARRLANDADEDRDEEEIRDLLRRVTDQNGRIRAERLADFYDTIASTADRIGNTVERARENLAAVRADIADETAAVPIVRHRLGELERELSACEAAHADAAADLERVEATYDTKPGSYGALARLEELEVELDNLKREASAVASAVDEFESWVDDPAVRYAYLEDDLDFLADYLDEIESAIEHVEEDGRDPVGQWVRASILLRASRLLHGEVAADLEALRDWEDHERAAAVADRLAAQDERLDRYAERLLPLEPEALADEAHDVFDELEAALDDLERPVDWDDVHDALRTARSDLSALDVRVYGEAAGRE